MNKVSCITVTRNRVPHLKKCIKYFNEQTHKDKELIIVYYSSDKETESYLKENRNSFIDNNIYFYKFVEQEGLYLGAIRNFAISKSQGDWICIWDDDDYYDEKRIKNQLKFCLKEKIDACTLRSILIYSNKYQELKLTFERQEMGWEGSLLCKKNSMPKYVNKSKGEDTPVLERLYNEHKLLSYFDPELYVYIFHDQNVSGNVHKERIFDSSMSLDANKIREFKKKLDWI
tara:strand:+ start:4345 stop:5034 length:690 start_codon:yes stop_codon:yes gene_type:complete